MGIGSFSGVKSGRGVTLTPHPLLVPWSRKGRAIPLLLLWAVRPVQNLSACTRVHCTYFTQLRILTQLLSKHLSRIQKSFSNLGITSLNTCFRKNVSYSTETLSRANFQARVQNKEILGITSLNPCYWIDKSYPAETLRTAGKDK